MNRRSFLASLGLAPLVARSYFDMGPSWAKHASGLVLPPQYDVWLVTQELIDKGEPPLFYGKWSEDDPWPIACHPVKSIESIYIHG